MTAYAAAERAALCDLLQELGPDAPTLDEGWLTRDLTAHLVMRDRRPDASIGILVRPLAGHTVRVQRSFAARPWDELLGLLRSGPPAWSPVRLPGADELANLVEYVVHREDVVRAQPGWSPRVVEPGLDDALWRRLPGLAHMLYRRSSVGVDLRRETGQTARVRAGDPRVTVVGRPLELLLHAFGRTSVADVSVEGDPETVRRFSATPLTV